MYGGTLRNHLKQEKSFLFFRCSQRRVNSIEWQVVLFVRLLSKQALRFLRQDACATEHGENSNFPGSQFAPSFLMNFVPHIH